MKVSITLLVVIAGVLWLRGSYLRDRVEELETDRDRLKSRVRALEEKVEQLLPTLR